MNATSIVEAEINYLGEMEGRPYTDVADFSKNRVVLESRRVGIRDVRGMATAPSLDREGFVLARHETRLGNPRDQAEVTGTYLPEMQDLVQSLTGADRVIVTDGFVVRFNSPAEEKAVRPARFAHTDYTEQTFRRLIAVSSDRHIADETARQADTQRLIAESIDAPPGKRRWRRVVAVQTWRALSAPPQDVPLALCDAASVAEQDIVISEFASRMKDKVGNILEFCMYRPNPAHRWFYAPRMERDEVLVFTGFDFNAPSSARVLHTAFDDPTCPPGAVPRASIEARTFAFFA